VAAVQALLKRVWGTKILETLRWPAFHLSLLLITSPYIAHCLGACMIASALLSAAVLALLKIVWGTKILESLRWPLGSQFKNNYFAEMCSGCEEGSYLKGS